MKQSTIATLILIGVTAMWGLTFPLIHNAVAFMHPGLFVLIRMIIATVVIAPWVICRLHRANKFLLIGCLALALLNTATYIFQSKGLLTIPASRSAFITGISVVLVPLLMPLFKLGKPDNIALVSVVICITGLYVLTGHNLGQLSIGDFWTFNCALTYAVFIIVMQIMSSRASDYLLLCFYQIFFSVPFAMPFAGHVNLQQLSHPAVIIGLFFCGLFATSLSIYLQGRFQQYTNAAKTALIFSLEPVFATIFAYFINHNKITGNIIIGGLLIIMSIVLRDMWLALRLKNSTN